MLTDAKGSHIHSIFLTTEDYKGGKWNKAISKQYGPADKNRAFS